MTDDLFICVAARRGAVWTAVSVDNSNIPANRPRPEHESPSPLPLCNVRTDPTRTWRCQLEELDSDIEVVGLKLTNATACLHVHSLCLTVRVNMLNKMHYLRFEILFPGTAHALAVLRSAS